MARFCIFLCDTWCYVFLYANVLCWHWPMNTTNSWLVTSSQNTIALSWHLFHWHVYISWILFNLYRIICTHSNVRHVFSYICLTLQCQPSCCLSVDSVDTMDKYVVSLIGNPGATNSHLIGREQIYLSVNESSLSKLLHFKLSNLLKCLRSLWNCSIPTCLLACCLTAHQHYLGISSKNSWDNTYETC